MGLKIAIVGTAPTSRMLAPWNDETWRKWVCSAGNTDVPCADAWFELHALQDCGAPADAWWMEWLRQQEFDIYMQAENHLVPKAKRFPAAELLKMFPHDFFTSTIAWMQAFAIIQPEVEEIGLFGIDMAHDTEYAYQRPGCRYYILEARKRGIKVMVPGESDIDKPTPLYGYSQATPHARKFKARRDELEQLRVKWVNAEAQAEAMIRQIQLDHAKVLGAMENQRWIERTYS